jgi:tetratricopeptide (TPR) repeat protein
VFDWKSKKDNSEDNEVPAPRAEGGDAKNKEHPDFIEDHDDEDIKMSDHFQEGLKLYEEGKYLEALAEFDKAIQNDRRHEYAYYNKAETLYKLGRLEDALTPTIEKAIQVSNNILNECNTRKEIDRAQEAKEQLGKAYQLKGNILTDLGRKSEASDCFSRASKYHPRLGIATPKVDEKYIHNLIGAILSYLRVAAYQRDQALTDDGGDEDDKIANLEEYKKAYRHARERLNEYINIRPQNVDALFLKAEVIFDSLEPGEIKKEEIDEVKMSLNKVIEELDKNHAPSHSLLGLVYLDSKPLVPGLALERFDKAISIYENRLKEIDSININKPWMRANYDNHDTTGTKLPSWNDWGYTTLRIYLAHAIMGKSIALAYLGREREAMQNLEEAEKIHFDNFKRTASTDDPNYVSVRFSYADNFYKKSLVDIALAFVNFQNRLNTNVLIKLDHAENNIDMGIKFLEQLQKDLLMTPGKIKYTSARQIVSIQTADSNYNKLKEFIRQLRNGLQSGINPSFVQ